MDGCEICGDAVVCAWLGPGDETPRLACAKHDPVSGAAVALTPAGPNVVLQRWPVDAD